VAFRTAFEITTDEGLDTAMQRVHTALGLLDLTCAFEVLTHLNAYVCNNADLAVADAFWAVSASGWRTRRSAIEVIDACQSRNSVVRRSSAPSVAARAKGTRCNPDDLVCRHAKAWSPRRSRLTAWLAGFRVSSGYSSPAMG